MGAGVVEMVAVTVAVVVGVVVGVVVAVCRMNVGGYAEAVKHVEEDIEVKGGSE